MHDLKVIKFKSFYFTMLTTPTQDGDDGRILFQLVSQIRISHCC